MSLNTTQLKQMILSGTDNMLQLQSTIQILRGIIKDVETEKSIAVVTNSLLSSTKTQRIGLEIVCELIAYFSSDIVLENASFWSSKCAINGPQDKIRETKLKTIEKIIRNSSELPSFNKKFIAEQLFDTVQSCLNYRSITEKHIALVCLVECMKHFPSSLGNTKSKIEQFLVGFLENINDEDTANNAANAFHFLQQIGGAGVNGTNYVNNFQSQFLKLCATIHVLYDNFFEGITELDSSEKDYSEAFKFNQLPPNTTAERNLEVVAYRIINCLHFLRAMIVKAFPVEKRIVPKYVLDIIDRGLSTHICLSQNNMFVENKQASLLVQIQSQLLKLLRVFIIGKYTTLVPFSYIITKILVNTLKRMDTCTCLANDLSYKVMLYKTLTTWLSLVKVLNYPRLEESLISSLLKDICPAKKKISLSLTTNKKKTKQSHNSKLSVPNHIDESIGPSTNSIIKEQTSILALDVLQHFLNTHHMTSHNLIAQEVVPSVIRTLNDVQANRIEGPCSSIKCQIKLYEVLVAIVKQEHKLVSVPIQMMSSLFHRGENSRHYRISQISRKGLDLLAKISHPVCASLYVESSNVAVPIHPHGCFVPCEDDLVEITQLAVVENGAEYKHKKEITILSDIVIPKSITVSAEVDSQDAEDCPDSVVDLTEGAVEQMCETNEDKLERICENTLNDNNVFETANATIFDEIEKRNEPEEPPVKKRKDQDVNDDDVDAMCGDFQDVIQ